MVQFSQVKSMSSLFFWLVYFTLDGIYKVRFPFLLILDRTAGQSNIVGGQGLFVNGLEKMEKNLSSS